MVSLIYRLTLGSNVKDEDTDSDEPVCAPQRSRLTLSGYFATLGMSEGDNSENNHTIESSEEDDSTAAEEYPLPPALKKYANSKTSDKKARVAHQAIQDEIEELRSQLGTDVNIKVSYTISDSRALLIRTT